MRFLKFTINNFKGINDLTLDLSEAPNLSIYSLVGLNESGKTTILEAIDMFQNDVPLASRHNLIPRNLSSNFTGNVSVVAEIELEAGDADKIKHYAKSKHGFSLEHVGHKFTVTRQYKFDGSEHKEKKDQWVIELNGKAKGAKKARGMYDWDKSKWSDLVTYISTTLMPRIIYYPNFLFDFPERIYLNGDIGEKQSVYRKMLQDILDSLEEGLNIEKHVLERIKGASTDQAKRKALDSTLLKMSSKITDTVIKPWDSIFSSKGKSGGNDSKEVKIDYGEEQSDPADPETKRYYLSLSIKQGSEIYQIEERSLGFKWFFAFLMFTQFRKNRSTDEGETLFLVDEPASNLHSSMQQRLANEVKGIVDKSKLIFTTHSQYLINPDWLEATYVVRNKALDYSKELDYTTTETNIDAVAYKKFVAEHPNQQDYYQPVLDALDYEPSRLELTNPITIVEGKNDYYVYKYINSVILKGKYKLFFYPGNGAKGNGDVIRLYLAWGRKFNILLDADGAGTDAKEMYLRDIGIELTSQVYTLGDFKKSWNAAAIESLFTEKEKLEIVQFLFPRVNTYSKKKFNLSMQNMLFHQHTVKLSQTTIGKFETIFSKIEIKP